MSKYSGVLVKAVMHLRNQESCNIVRTEDVQVVVNPDQSVYGNRTTMKTICTKLANDQFNNMLKIRAENDAEFGEQYNDDDIAVTFTIKEVKPVLAK